MPQFDPSSSKIARAPITVKPAGLIGTAELYLVSNATKVASSGEVSFTSTGAAQSVSFPITMPAAEGTYKVYIDVFSDDELIGVFVAREDVVISAPVGAWECPVCGARFATWDGLRAHINVNHANDFQVGVLLERPGGWQDTTSIRLRAASNVPCRLVFWLEKPDGTGWKVGERTTYSTSEYSVTLRNLPLGPYVFRPLGISRANKVSWGYGSFSSY